MFINYIRNSKPIRAPLLAVVRRVFRLLNGGSGLLHRAVYDSLPVPYVVTGHPEKFIVSTADKVIGREVFLRGEFDFSKLETALSILAREGFPLPTHLIDVGANIGTITIPALKRGLIKTATAIEPHPENLRLLRANIALNGVDDHVVVLPQAVGDLSSVTLHLHESDTNSGNHSIGDDGIPVSSSRLDDLTFPPDSLLWMDIEGYEGHALKDAEKLLATGIPVVCEFNPTFLSRTGGMDALTQAFANKKIYDLGCAGSPQSSLEAITAKYSTDIQHTDILVIS